MTANEAPTGSYWKSKCTDLARENKTLKEKVESLEAENTRLKHLDIKKVRKQIEKELEEKDAPKKR